VLAVAAVLTFSSAVPHGQVRLRDETDRAALRAWFVYLADAQIVQRSADVTDCAALVRHAFREALRPHTPEWRRLNAVPGLPAFADVRQPPHPVAAGLPLFRISRSAAAAAQEFADARPILKYNTRSIGRSLAALLQPGDLLFFSDPDRRADHVMVFVGRSPFEASGSDWVVYHTGPDGAREGDIRKVTLRDLTAHPIARWRPIAANRYFAGAFRLLAFLPSS
jgi:uncharacterized protein YfaT (DUF1175 family)